MKTVKSQNKIKVSFREITPENFDECIKLKVAEEQEKFVASNVMTIAASKVYPTVQVLAIYAGDKMVGLVKYGFDEEEERYYLGRLMIDEKYQGRGYGKAATLEVVERLRQIEECKEIHLLVSPQNTNAERLYSKVGFKRTGEMIDGEALMRFDLERQKHARK